MVSGVAQALAIDWVTAAVCEVTVTSLVTAGSPPASLTVTHTSTLITWRHVAVASAWTFQPPVAPTALTAACKLVAAGANGSPAVALTRFGASRRPPALVAGAVSVDGVAVPVSATPASILAQRTPAAGVAGALTCDRVTVAVWVARTHLSTV